MAVKRLFEKIIRFWELWYSIVSRDDAFFTWLSRLFHSVFSAIEKEQSPNFVEDRGTSRRFSTRIVAFFLLLTWCRSIRCNPTYDDHLVLYTWSSTAYWRSAGEPATNVDCHAADRLYDRMVSGHSLYMRRAAEFSIDCIRSSWHVCRPVSMLLQ